MTNNAEVYKTFDRSTAAGRAMWALYNARGNEAEKLGNDYSTKNRAVVEARRQRCAEDPDYAAAVQAAADAKLPARAPKLVAGESATTKVRVPRVGRRSGGGGDGGGYGSGPFPVPRPGRRPAGQIKRENRREEIRQAQSMAFEAERRAAQGGDREQQIYDLQQANALHGSDMEQLAKAVMADDVVRQSSNRPTGGPPDAVDEFAALMEEVRAAPPAPQSLGPRIRARSLSLSASPPPPPPPAGRPAAR